MEHTNVVRRTARMLAIFVEADLGKLAIGDGNVAKQTRYDCVDPW
jgi:hypothetical protein